MIVSPRILVIASNMTFVKVALFVATLAFMTQLQTHLETIIRKRGESIARPLPEPLSPLAF